MLRHHQPSIMRPETTRSLPPSSPEQAAESSKPAAELIRELELVRTKMLRFEEAGMRRAPHIHPSYDLSARNLLHYLAMRSGDMRPLQEALRARGLSSLGRAEAHARCTVEAVLDVLSRLEGRLSESRADLQRFPGFGDGPRLLERHSLALLGPEPPGRRVRIMVTMPSEAADDVALVRGLLEHGMDCARINCAHDGADAWERMIDNVRHAERATGRRCRVMMDLAGPKLRTGPLEPGPAVLKLRPLRDELGRIVQPTRLWITAAESPCAPPASADAVLPVRGKWLEELSEGDVIEFVDARAAERELRVTRRLAGGAWAELERTAYLVPGTALLPRGEGRMVGHVGELSQREGSLLLRPGDLLTLTRSLAPGRNAEFDSHGRLLSAAYIGCTLPEVFESVRVGENVWLDDGRIGARVRAVAHEQLSLEITNARPEGERLRADKGINLPDTAMSLPALTPKDLKDLEFIAAHADIVALSFVHAAADVDELEERLRELGKPELGIVLKIETKRAFESLPQLLLASMQSPCDGVMIARGDLAVECGFERMAEVQEEILWICEAAHVPVIWATQVLETLAKTGRPSRAEITDAAMGERAECVMLNKGPHIEAAVTALDDILRRMEGHQQKKSARLRPLSLAHSIEL